MKTITIGDIHGSPYWKAIDIDKYDKVIFMGDYVDDFPPRTDKDIIDNLQEIIHLKRNNPDKVVLLLGNHDVQYMFLENRGKYHACSGFRASMSLELKYIFNYNKDMFKLALEYNSNGKTHLWTHAGVVTRWYLDRFRFRDNEDVIGYGIGNQLNEAFEQYEICLFDIGYMRYGTYPNGGPLWADAMELIEDPLDNLHQIVGHSKVTEIKTINKKDRDASVTFVDRLHEAPDFYELNI